MPNQYVNKVVYGNDTLIDITDTTAVASDVASGKYFYTADGAKTQGTATGGSVLIVDTEDAGGGTIREITTGGEAITLQNGKTVTLTTPNQTIYPASGYDGFTSVTVDASSISGGNKWIRPADWPDYDQYDFDGEECLFLTYDSTAHDPLDWMGLKFYSNWVIERGYLSDGVWAVEETHNVAANAVYSEHLPLDRDYTVYKVYPQNGYHITGCKMANPVSYNGKTSFPSTFFLYQKNVERYGNLPYLSTKPFMDWSCIYLVSETQLSMSGRDFQSVYNNSARLENLVFKNWSRHVTFLYNTFGNCRALKYINLEDWTTVDGAMTSTGFVLTFCSCNLLEKIDLNHWDITGATNLSTFINNCTNLKSINIKDWDVSGVTNMSQMFINDSSLEDIDLSTWDTSSVTNFWRMFRCCQSLKASPINSFDFSAATNTEEILYQCYSITGDVILNDITVVGSNAFNDCRMVDNFVFRVSAVPTLSNTNAFSNNSFANGQRILFPASLVEEAKAATNWSTYADYIEAIEET